MDERRFEDLSRQVGAAATRRGALKALVGGMASLVVGLRRPGHGSAEEIELPTTIPIAHCRPQLVKCHDDRQCCSGTCKKNLTAEIRRLAPHRPRGGLRLPPVGRDLLSPPGRQLLLQRPVH